MTLSEQALEAAARAVCLANCPPTMDQDRIECQVHSGWDMWLPEARAAVTAYFSALPIEDDEK